MIPHSTLTIRIKFCMQIQYVTIRHVVMQYFTFRLAVDLSHVACHEATRRHRREQFMAINGYMSTQSVQLWTKHDSYLARKIGVDIYIAYLKMLDACDIVKLPCLYIRL